jgi:hypothetical protein
MLRLAKRISKLSSSSLELPSSLDVVGGGSRFYLLLFVVLCHEAIVADVEKEKTLVDGDVGGILVGGGVGGALVRVPFPIYMGIASFLLVVPLLLLLPLLSLSLSLSLDIGNLAIK